MEVLDEIAEVNMNVRSAFRQAKLYNSRKRFNFNENFLLQHESQELQKKGNGPHLLSAETPKVSATYTRKSNSDVKYLKRKNTNHLQLDPDVKEDCPTTQGILSPAMTIPIRKS